MGFYKKFDFKINLVSVCRSSNFLNKKYLRSNQCKIKYIKCFKGIKKPKIKNLEMVGVEPTSKMEQSKPLRA